MRSIFYVVLSTHSVVLPICRVTLSTCSLILPICHVVLSNCCRLVRVVIKSRGPRIFPRYQESGPQLLLLENRRKTGPKEIPSHLIPRLLVFTRQLEILVTTLLVYLFCHLADLLFHLSTCCVVLSNCCVVLSNCCIVLSTCSFDLPIYHVVLSNCCVILIV